MRYVQEHYVPKSKSLDENNKVVENVLKRIPFGGDQLTEDRAMSAHRALIDGETDLEKLRGLDSKFEDWHLKVNLYKVNI